MSSSISMRREVRKIVFRGKMAMITFILFNLLMPIVALISTFDIVRQSSRDYGVAIATGVLLAVWSLGSLVLGLLSLESRTIIEERKP